jgi:5-methylcytosine-specific restriction endonuclease McrA
MNKQLIAYIQSGQLMKFYKSREWMALRKKALERDHFECQRCKDLGKYHKAECVHHVKEVKPFPHLALSLSNLKCLCNACHNAVHDRMADHLQQHGKKFVNEERW